MRTYSRTGLHAFTLIELMVVVAILGVLGMVVATNVFPYFWEGQQTVTRTNIKTLAAEITKYRFHHFRLPEDLDALLQPNEKNMDQPYIENADLLLDPWGYDYIYVIENDAGFEIKSLGSDQTEGGEGAAQDISSKDSRRKEK
jgi:general secretion pathway protein G